MPLALSLVLAGAVTLSKTGTLVSDPVNGALAPKAIPSAVVEYEITVRNASTSPLDSGALTITDPVPPRTKLCLADLGGRGSGPVASSQGFPASGLSTVFTSLDSTTDDLLFSSDNGFSYGYTPQPDSSGCDGAVTHLKIRTRGVGAVGGVYRVRFRVAVR